MRANAWRRIQKQLHQHELKLESIQPRSAQCRKRSTNEIEWQSLAETDIERRPDVTHRQGTFA